MEDQVAAGLLIIDGSTRVRRRNPPSLVKLEDLSGSGPAGPPGPPGDPVDTTQFYNKTAMNIMLGLKEDNIVSTLGTGTVLFNDGQLRRLIAGTGLSITIDGNDNIILTTTGSSSGIPSTVAEFLSTGITLKLPTICNLGLTVANTLVADEVHTGTIRANYFIANGASEVTLLGTTEASVACAADTLGLTVVRARNRSSTQGCLIGTNTANADLCLQNTTASRSIRLAGDVMSLGDLTSPGMTLSNSGISLLKDVTCSTSLGVSGPFVAGGAALCLQGLKVTGVIDAGANSSVGCYSGLEATVGFARHTLCCASSSSRCLIDMSFGGSNQGHPSARIECIPAGATGAELILHTDGASRCVIGNDAMAISTDLTVAGDISATNMMPRSELAST